MLFNKVKQFWKQDTKAKNENALPDSIVKAYNNSRRISQKKFLCHAPFNNMYFNTEGHIAVCWLTFNNPVIYSEAKTIKEFWEDAKFKSLRAHIQENDLSFQCTTCEKYLKEGNYVNVLARAYDNDYKLTDYPSIMEFELDNTCNLGCTMCNGMLSSSIRKDREKLPALESPYGEKFLQELREFIPHLREARFNGGEPFLIKNYYRIWDMIFELNPSIGITIATNGTVLNTRVKEYLDRGIFNLNISMDGFSKSSYESIRLNGNHDKLMQNFEWFNEYCKKKGSTLCIMVNPMRQNWHEMTDFVNWCNQKDVNIWFNTIVRPEDQAIWKLSAAKLEEVYQTLSSAAILPNISTRRGIYTYNVNTYKNLVEQQIKTWWQEAKERENKVINSTLEFQKKLEMRVPNKNELHDLNVKIAELKDALSAEINEDDFYERLNKLDVNTVMLYFSKHSVEELRTYYINQSAQ